MKTIKFITTQLALIFISYGISTALYTLHIIDSIELVYIVTTALYITLFIATWLICSKLNKKGSQVNLSTYNELLDECNKLEVENAKANNKYVKMTDERNRIKFEYDKLVIKNEVPFSEPIHQCKSCGSDDTRETKCYWICNVCKSREKKEVK